MATATNGKIERLERIISELTAKQTRLRDQVFGDSATEDAKAQLANVDADLSRLHFQVAELELAS